ncbi:MAG: beta-propeller fold lactonase family protein, partial [Mucilaginibacter sp.]|uniref:MBG domain-containing protein n=1 Tax=Mucilaginibacter sp. TaxID=1882438 RepID=UPI002619AA82
MVKYLRAVLFVIIFLAPSVVFAKSFSGSATAKSNNNSMASPITITGSISALTTVYGTPSASSSFTVSGNDLLDVIKILAPPGFEVSTDNVNFFSNPNPVTLGGWLFVPTVPTTTIYVRLSATASAGTHSGNINITTYTWDVPFPWFFSVNVPIPTSTVTPAPLTITANNTSKTYGTAIAGGTGSAAFTSPGLQNSETIGSVSIAYGTGAAANAAVGTYIGSVVPSAATGGSFNPSNY